jgi:polyhydroxybutyrate depolymerase
VTRTARTAAALALAVLLASCAGSSGDDAVTARTTTTAVATTAPSTAKTARLGPGEHRMTVDVEGTPRTAIVVVPSHGTGPRPTVFVFHGHGGSGAGIQRQLHIEQAWPEAVVVYPDGLVGHVGITDPAGRLPGWQSTVGEADDRDLAFFDALLARLRTDVDLDASRLYVAGHSNGSQMASLLLNQRGAEIAASANLSAVPAPAIVNSDPVRSMFVSLGMTDEVVPYDRQKLVLPLIERHLGVDSAAATTDGYLRQMHAPGDIELDTYIHPGGHPPPEGISARIVEFFQRHSLRDG